MSLMPSPRCRLCEDPLALEESERRGWPVLRVVVEAEMPEQRERRLASEAARVLRAWRRRDG